MRQKAAIAGLLYLICIVSGFSAEAFVRGTLVAYGDAALTASRILAAPSVYRWGFLADLISFTTGILVSVIFYDLFRVVSRPVARVALAFAIVSNTVSIAASIFCYAPLYLLSGANYLDAFAPGQLHAMALLSLHLYQFAFMVNLGLFSVDCLATGYLIYKSTFLPRVLGVMLAIGGVGYLYNSVAYFMPPAVLPDLFPYSYVPSFIAETTLALWLVIARVDAGPTAR